MPFQVTDELAINLTVGEWNQVIAALQEEKQRIANPIINKINLQASQHEQNQAVKEQQATPQMAPTPDGQPLPPIYANGELRGDISPMPDAPRPPGWTEGE